MANEDHLVYSGICKYFCPNFSGKITQYALLKNCKLHITKQYSKVLFSKSRDTVKEGKQVDNSALMHNNTFLSQRKSSVKKSYDNNI